MKLMIITSSQRLAASVVVKNSNFSEQKFVAFNQLYMILFYVLNIEKIKFERGKGGSIYVGTTKNSIMKMNFEEEYTTVMQVPNLILTFTVQIFVKKIPIMKFQTTVQLS